MENRKQAILRAVVQEFTSSAVPVGSQSLQSRYFVNLSSATIRSELAELADLGYLAQPHTSAGRIPTDSASNGFAFTSTKSYGMGRPTSRAWSKGWR